MRLDNLPPTAGRGGGADIEAAIRWLRANAAKYTLGRMRGVEPGTVHAIVEDDHRVPRPSTSKPLSTADRSFLQ